MSAREVLEMNVRVVRERELEPFLAQAWRVARMVLDEPVWTGSATGYDRDDILRRKAEYRGVFDRRTIRDWLSAHYRPGSDLEVVEVYEFGHYNELVDFLGADPESSGVAVPDSLASRYRELEPDTWPAEGSQFLSRMAVIHFGTALGPAIEECERQGRAWSGLRLMEETGVVDRWALGYVAARGRIRGRLMLRVRGLWALWPLVR